MKGATSYETPLGRELVATHLSVRGKDGQIYFLRPISPSDAPSLARGYDAMSDEAKWFRMLNAIPHLTAEMAHRFCSPDPARELCIVIEGRGSLNGEILGGARIAGKPGDRSAEFSVSLRPEAQGLGLGHHVLETALQEAREMGYKNVWGSIAVYNAPMLALARRMGFELSPDADDHTLIRANLALDG